MTNKCSACGCDLKIVLNKYGVIDIMKSDTIYSNNRCLKCFEKSFEMGLENNSINSLLINSIIIK